MAVEQNRETIKIEEFFKKGGAVVREIGKYRVIKQVDKNSQGFTYEAVEIDGDKRVTIHEFFPHNLVTREQDNIVKPKEEKLVVFKYLLEDFIELFHFLKNVPKGQQMHMPKFVELIRENNTAYGVVEYVEGISLEAYLLEHGSKMKAEEFILLIEPIYELLNYLHTVGRLHRAVSTDTIIISGDNIILDGLYIPSARTSGSELSPELEGNYYPPDQLDPSFWQNESLDVYSFAAVCLRAITGVTIPEAKARQKGKNYRVPKNIIQSDLLNVLNRSLALSKEQRHRTISDLWREMLSPPKIESVLEESTKKVDIIIVLISIVFFTGMIFWLASFVTPNEKEISSSSAPEAPLPVVSSSEAVLEEESKPLEAPNFIGRYYDTTLISYSGEYTLMLDWEYSETERHGIIIAQDVHGFDEFGNPQLWLLVSLGSEWATMPDLKGLTEDEATRILTSLSIPYSIRRSANIAHDRGVVTSTSIEAGVTFSRRDTSVTINVVL